MYSADEYYEDSITSGPDLEDLHGLDWGANESARELDEEPPGGAGPAAEESEPRTTADGLPF